MSESQPFLALLGPPLRRAILRHYNPDSCVASSAIGLLVLRELGFEVRPLSVRAMLANHAFVERTEREGHVPRNKNERERWFTENGCHAIGLGVPDHDPTSNPLVNGLHVALLVGNKWLWDLSIDQASRPEHGIVIKEPFLGDAGRSPHFRKWLRGQAQIMWEAPGRGLVLYTVKPHDERYLEHVNWRADGHDAPKRQAIAHEAVLALRGELGAQRVDLV